jgi:hypothetical protein
MRRLYLIVALALFVVGGVTAVNAQQSTTQGGTPAVSCATPAASPAASPSSLATAVTGAGPVVASPQPTHDPSGRMAVLNDCATVIASATP